ncbi:MAG: tetratricopeptide repeat protein [Opitutaceae bacterium]
MKQSRPRRPKHRMLLALVLAVAGLAIAWRAAVMMRRHSVAALAIPARPELSAWPAELTEKIAAAEKSAGGYFRVVPGMAALSRLYHANGFYAEAGQCYEGLQQLERREARWAHLKAAIAAEFGRLEEALPAERRAVQLAPAYLPARLRLGDILLKSNQTAPAAEAYAAALQREPGNPYALLGLAKCALARGDWAAAREHLRENVKLHPDFVGALSLLVTVSEHFQDEREAASLRAAIGRREFNDLNDPWVESLADDCFDPYRLSVAAALAKFAGDNVAARRWLERAVELAPTAGAYRRQLGKLLFQSRELLPARQQLEKAVALAPADSDAWILLVEILTAGKDVPAAQRALAAGLAACPQSPALHHLSGQKLSAQGRNGEAITEFQTAKTLRPNEANAYVDLALVYLRLERIEEAMAEMRAALAVQPGHALAMSVLARFAIDTGDEAAARHWIQQLREQQRLPPNDLNALVMQFQQQFRRAL